MFNVPKIVEAALPEEKRNGRTLGIVGGSMAGAGPNHNDQSFLSDDFPKSKPKLYITAGEEDGDFDEMTSFQWRNEGYDILGYIGLGDGGSDYQAQLKALATQDLGPCESFGIVAYGRAAAECLSFFHVLDNNPSFKLGLLIAYYPTSIPDPRTRFPGGVNVLVHLAEGQETIGIVKQDQMVGIQGKKRTVKRPIKQGMGTGKLVKYNYPAYSYDADPGFAEESSDAFDAVSADLAWTRSLTAAQRAFKRPISLERQHEENVNAKYYTQDLKQCMKTYTQNTTPAVTYMPTLTGGIDADELQDFYGHFFFNKNPKSLRLTLLSRTMNGVNRIVDELHVTFKHTTEMPWILPNIPPTKKTVEVTVVSIVSFQGGKVSHERMYWDQASVLYQVGLLDPNLVPPPAKKRGVTKLPVVGREAAQRRLNGNEEGEDGEADNNLIPDWYDDDEDEDEEDEEDEEEDGEDEEDQEDDEDQEDEAGDDNRDHNGGVRQQNGAQGQANHNEQDDEEGSEEEEEGEVSDDGSHDGNHDDDDTMVEPDKAHHSDEEPSRRS